ncbi:hypothetical protein ZIOFF_043892 [Zingiber officinale]|uniref:Nucleotide-diphospho-sugar transferase domain-containing protein n=1 Tax=Zingiber officinale TaxID=94328 RepID=A0A8J5KU71_ZINOF|nr:hypothetical protein ZIOFF_043892 [Zingiber officinale]
MTLNRRQPPLLEVAKHGLLSSRASQPQGIVSSFLFSRSGFLSVLALLLLLLVFPLLCRRPVSALLYSFSLGEVDDGSVSRWKDYTVARAAAFAARNDTLIVTAVSEPFLPLLNNWLISIARKKRQDQVLIFAEDYATLYEINRRWPGHAVLVQPAPDSNAAHDYGSQGFFNITSRRPRHLLQLLKLGYSVMYNDVDMVWVADPFRYLDGDHDVYFADDMFAVSSLSSIHGGEASESLSQSAASRERRPDQHLQLHDFPPSDEGRQEADPQLDRGNPKAALVQGGEDKRPARFQLCSEKNRKRGLYFRDAHWVKRTQGLHAIVHNNYIVGLQNKIRRFKDYGLWLADNHTDESPLGQI